MRRALGAMAMAILAAGAPDLSWILDDELQSRADLERTQAVASDERATLADAERTGLVQRRDAALAERDGVAATLESLARVKRGLAESRIKELDGQIAGWDTRIASLDRQATDARKDAETRRAFAASVDQEAAARTKQAADAVEPKADAIAGLSDARLRAAKVYYARRAARISVQLATIERMTKNPATISTARATLFAQTGQVRALRDEDAAVVGMIDEELRFRAESRDDEGRQADELARVGVAKAAATETIPVLVVSTARSAELDVALDRIIASEDEAARKARQRSKLVSGVVRWVVGLGVLAAASGAVWLFAFRGPLSRSNGRNR